MQVHRHYLDRMVRREGRPVCDATADFDAEETACPACGTRFRTAGVTRCPDCGLRFA
jgi:tRNA(Ile2) C34 agmatinyltransferase TiaS